LLVIESGWLIGTASLLLLTVTLYRAEYWRFLRPLPRILVVLAVWRFVLWIWGGIATWYSTPINSIGPALTTGGAINPRDHFIYRTLVYSWMQWDSGYYRAIAVDGYNTTDTFPRIAFFPLFPALIRIVRPLLGGDASTAAIVVSNVALVVGVLLLYDLARCDFGHSVAYRSVVFLLIFPTSFFFVSGYSESVGLALLCGAIWAIRRQRWWIAGIAGFFLALSRLPGVMLAPILAVAYLQEHHWHWRSIKRPPFLVVVLPLVGLACFILYQWWRFDEPLAFLRVQAAWDNHLRMPWRTPFELLTTIPTNPGWPLRVGQLLVWFCFIGLSIQALRHMPLVYGLTMVLILLPPYFSSNESLPRYVLLAFPGFIMMALMIKRKWLYVLLLGTMTILCAISTMLFVNKFWIA
jgi:hypothetical protein